MNRVRCNLAKIEIGKGDIHQIGGSNPKTCGGNGKGDSHQIGGSNHKLLLLKDLRETEKVDVTFSCSFSCSYRPDNNLGLHWQHRSVRRRGIKIAGPIPLLFADRMIDGLRELLQQLGYKVIIETAADD